MTPSEFGVPFWGDENVLRWDETGVMVNVLNVTEFSLYMLKWLKG